VRGLRALLRATHGGCNRVPAACAPPAPFGSSAREQRLVAVIATLSAGCATATEPDMSDLGASGSGTGQAMGGAADQGTSGSAERRRRSDDRNRRSKQQLAPAPAEQRRAARKPEARAAAERQPRERPLRAVARQRMAHPPVGAAAVEQPLAAAPALLRRTVSVIRGPSTPPCKAGPCVITARRSRPSLPPAQES
jgi:hypothetical protein